MTATIRPATPEDLPRAVEMAAKFHGFAGFESLAPFCPHSTAATGQILIDHGVFLVADADGELLGMIGLMLAPVMHNHAFRQAVETMWWVEPVKRAAGVGDALFSSAEDAAKAKGATTILMIHLSNSPASARIAYESRAYAPLETVYIKVL